MLIPELTASGAAVLSLLTFGEASGYELRTRADATLRFFFAAPAMSQIYAELDRLAADGLVAEPRRPAAGQRARPGVAAHGQGPAPAGPLGRRGAGAAHRCYRDHLALRLMLGALVAPERLEQMVDEQRERIEADRADLRAVAEELDPTDPAVAHPALVAEWGLDTYDAELAALDRVRARLADLPRAPAPGADAVDPA